MIHLTGVSEFQAAVEAEVTRKIAATRAATARSAHLIERKAKEKLGTYSHQRGTATPSPAGDPPAVVSGTLRRSITVTGPTAMGFDRFKAEIGPTALYGRIQELGGELPHGGELPARPYMEPALNDCLPQIRTIFVTAWR